MARRTKEQLSWDTFSKGIEGNRLLHHRVENMCGNGTPDVVALNNYGTTIWVENKAVLFWPKRPDTVVLPASAFEPGQLGWLRAWRFRGGHAFVLLRVEHEFFLLDPEHKVELMNRAGLYAHAIARDKSKILEHLYTLKRDDQ